jgi:hypothetical protein
VDFIFSDIFASRLLKFRNGKLIAYEKAHRKITEHETKTETIKER